MPSMRKNFVTAPLELSTLTAQPPELGAEMIQGPITNGSDAVPLPSVTHVQAWKPASEVIVIAACDCGAAVTAGPARTRAAARATAAPAGRSTRRIAAPFSLYRGCVRGRRRSRTEHASNRPAPLDLAVEAL